MNVRYIVLLAGSALVFASLLWLALAVDRPPELDIPEKALAQAQQRYERAHAAPSAVADPITSPTDSHEPAQARPSDSRPEPPPLTRPRNPPDDTRINPRNDPRANVGSSPSPPAPVADEGAQALKRRMDLSNRYYDRGEYDLAVEQALTILEEQPDNVRMLRVMVSAGCLMGEEEQAREYFPKLPSDAQRVMRIRCARYGIEL